MNGASITVETILLILGSGGIGGLLTWASSFYFGKRTADETTRTNDQQFIQQGFELAVKVITEQRDDAIGINREYIKRIENLELEVVGLKLANSFDPFPRWMVDLEGRFLYVNACFEERYLLPASLSRRDIIGKGHDAIWPPELCATLKQLDQVARSRPDGRARAVIQMAGGEVSLFKFPVRVHGVIVAYAGYIMEHA